MTISGVPGRWRLGSRPPEAQSFTYVRGRVESDESLASALERHLRDPEAGSDADPSGNPPPSVSTTRLALVEMDRPVFPALPGIEGRKARTWIVVELDPPEE